MFEAEPRKEKTWLAKAVTLLATIFGISLGLCGVNVLAFMGGLADNRGAAPFLIVAAYLEVAGMVLSASGLLVVAGTLMVRAAAEYFNRDTGGN